MKKTTYIFVLITLIAGMTFFGTDLIGQGPPDPGDGNGESPLEINIILFIGAMIYYVRYHHPNTSKINS